MSGFDFDLPEHLIAQHPPAERGAARMLVVHRQNGLIEDRAFGEFPSFLAVGDCVVINDTKVFPARLFGHRVGFQGRVEVLLVRPVGEDGLAWLCLVHPGRKVRSGERIEFGPEFTGEVLGRNERGERVVRFHAAGGLMASLERHGHVPLPPYIRRPDTALDRERYQTVFAEHQGSVAAPTAGLHFTEYVLSQCPSVARLTLHVGLGTFQPIRCEKLEEVRLHVEWFSIREEEATRMRAARRLVAVGTTMVRSIETAMLRGGLRAMEGDTDLFIRPGFPFQATGAMLTNFHLPRSSLFVLVCAFAGIDVARAAYRHAIEREYRFYSYGDCMLIL